MTHVTVSMPTRDTPPDLLLRAVRSVLGQTHRDLTLVVVDDASTRPLPDLPDDPRLVVFRLPVNRGRYFADRVVLESAPPGAFAVHDSDDSTDPEHLARLLDALPAGEGSAIGPYWRSDAASARVIEPNLSALDAASFRHVVHWGAALSTVERMRRAGGLLPHPRLGFDTLHTLLIAMTGPVAVVDHPTYLWDRRSGSLTSSRETGFGSRERQQAKARLVRIFQGARRVADAGGSVAEEIERHVSSQFREATRVQAARLRRML